MLSPKDRVGSPLLGNVDTQRNIWPVLGIVKSDHLIEPQTLACRRQRKEPPVLLKLQGAKAPAVGSPLLGNLNSQKQYMLFTHGNVEHHETGFTPQTYVTKAVAKVLRHS